MKLCPRKSRSQVIASCSTLDLRRATAYSMRSLQESLTSRCSAEVPSRGARSSSATPITELPRRHNR
jgi:hypothetical protein